MNFWVHWTEEKGFDILKYLLLGWGAIRKVDMQLSDKEIRSVMCFPQELNYAIVDIKGMKRKMREIIKDNMCLSGES